MSQVQDSALWFFRDALSYTGGSLPDLELAWLATQGYAQGSLDERWRAYGEDRGLYLYNSFLIRDWVVNGGGVAVPNILYDLDIDSDVDDVGDFALLGALAYRGECRIGSITVASKDPDAAPAARVCRDYIAQLPGMEYLSSVPMGAYQGSAIGGGTGSDYTPSLRREFAMDGGDTRANYTAPETILRQALVDSPGRTAKIFVTGTLTNIATLLATAADGISALNGVDLVAAKCDSIHVMAGNFDTGASENNAAFDITAANYVAANSPVPVYWTGLEVGNDIDTGYPNYATYPYNPFARAWALGGATLDGNGERPSWAQHTLIYAVRGPGTLYDVSALGTVSFNVTTFETTFTPGAGVSRYLAKVASDATIKAEINGLIAELATALIPYYTISGFTPAYFGADLLAWFDADDLATLFQSNAGTTAVTSDGDVVGAWTDKAGNVSVSSPADDGTRPVWHTSGGLDWVDSDGTDDVLRALSSAGVYAAGAATIAAGLRGNPALGSEVLFSEASSASDNPYYRVLARSSAPLTTATINIRRDGATTLLTQNSSAVALAFNDTDRVLMFRDDGAIMRAFLNGSFADSDAYTRSGTMTVNRFGLFALVRASNSAYWRGRLYSFVIVGRPLTVRERVALQSYVGTKAGLTI